jgi:ornithine cyclodeaminase/alanine dehydrogenase-like protein (mu-crystallin family)
VQGRAHLPFLRAVLPALERVLLVEPEAVVARAAAREAEALGLGAEVLADPREACRRSDVCVTCTPSRTPLLDAGDARPGSVVAGVGADNEQKHELAPGLLAGSAVIVDLLVQCERVGDLHHAIAAGAMRADQVRAELGDVLAGRRPGRVDEDEVIVFDSTGMALQDVAACAAVYERALGAGRGIPLDIWTATIPAPPDAG